MFQIGNGPFNLQTVEPSVRQYFVPNSEYWGEKPTYDLEYRYIPDATAALEAYKNNELDIIPSTVENLDAINADPNLKAQHIVYPGSCTFVFKFSLAPDSIFQDKKVREAFAYGFDTEGWSRDVDNGFTTPTQTWIAPGSPGYDASETSLKFDPEKARQSLAESTYRGPQALNNLGLKIAFADTPLNRTRTEWLVNNYKQVLGVDLALDPVDQLTFSARARDPNTFPLLVRQGWCADYPDPQNWLSVYWKSDTTFAQRQGYKNEEFDNLVSQADAETGSVQTPGADICRPKGFWCRTSRRSLAITQQITIWSSRGSRALPGLRKTRIGRAPLCRRASGSIRRCSHDSLTLLGMAKKLAQPA